MIKSLNVEWLDSSGSVPDRLSANSLFFHPDIPRYKAFRE